MFSRLPALRPCSLMSSASIPICISLRVISAGKRTRSLPIRHLHSAAPRPSLAMMSVMTPWLGSRENHTNLRQPLARRLASTAAAEASPTTVKRPEARKLISFVCKVCENRITKTMSTHAYEKGVVLIKCDGCSNNHLIADNLNWFQSGRNVEDILRLSGQKVKTFMSLEEVNGTAPAIELTPEELEAIQKALNPEVAEPKQE